jgi:hypothetical protein
MLVPEVVEAKPVDSQSSVGEVMAAEHIIPVDVNGTTILVAATVRGGDQEIAGVGLPSFEGVGSAIESIASAVTAALARVSPKKANVEFGCEVALEAGHLTALLVKGTGTASIKVTLEWGSD